MLRTCKGFEITRTMYSNSCKFLKWQWELETFKKSKKILFLWIFYELFQPLLSLNGLLRPVLLCCLFFVWLLLEVQWTQPFFIKVCKCKFLILFLQVSYLSHFNNKSCVFAVYKDDKKNIKLNTNSDIQNMNIWHFIFCQFVYIIIRLFCFWQQTQERFVVCKLLGAIVILVGFCQKVEYHRKLYFDYHWWNLL